MVAQRNPKYARQRTIVVATIAIVFALVACNQQPVQTAQVSAPPGKDWDSIKTLPDFYTGIWQPIAGQDDGDRAAQYRTQPPLTPEWQKKFDAANKIVAAGGNLPAGICSPRGLPGGMSGPDTLIAFAFTPGRVVITRANASARHIYMDGRTLPADPDESFQGFSVGHWEDGKTLVVETVGLDHNNELIYGIAGGKNMHVLERMALKDADTLQIETEIAAPEALTQKISRSTSYARHADWAMVPHGCSQILNDRGSSNAAENPKPDAQPSGQKP